MGFVRRGSPLVIGVKSDAKFATDHFPVVYSKGIRQLMVSTLIKSAGFTCTFRILLVICDIFVTIYLCEPRELNIRLKFVRTYV